MSGAFGKFIKILIFLLLLTFTSELIFTIKNQSGFIQRNILNYYFVKKSINSAKNRDSVMAIKNLDQAAIGTIRMIKKLRTEDIYPTEYNSVIPNSSNFDFLNNVSDYINTLDHPKIFQRYEDVKLSKIFYYLALIANKDNEKGMVEKFLQTSVFLAPDFATSHVELANFYLSIGEADKSKSAYEFCFEFELPKDYCLYYFDLNFKNNITKEIGFLKDDVNRFYVTDNN